MDYNVRIANLKDTISIATIHYESFINVYNGLLHEEDLRNGKSISNRILYREEVLNDPGMLTFLIFKNNVLAGFCDLKKDHFNYLEDIEDVNVRMRVKSEINSIYILPQYQRLGAGSFLLNYVKIWTQVEKLSPYFLWVLEDNKIAIRFYEKHKGVLIGRRKTFIGKRFYNEVAFYFPFEK